MVTPLQEKDPFSDLIEEDPFADLIEQEEVDPFADLIPQEDRLSPQSQLDLDTANGNPQQNELLSLFGSRNVEVPKGGLAKFIEIFKLGLDTGTDEVEKNLLGAEIVFESRLTDPPSEEREARITALNRRIAGKDPEGLEGVILPLGDEDEPEEEPGFLTVEFWADTVGKQVPVLWNMGREGIESALAAGTVHAATIPLTGGLSAPFFPGTLAVAGGTGALNNAFKQMTGAAYLEYRNFVDDEGNKLPEALARVGAVMSGAVGTGLEALPFGLLARMMPGVGKLFKKAGMKATEALKFPTTTQAMKTFLFKLSQMMLAEGGTEALQELTQVVTGETMKAFAEASGAGEFESVTTQETLARMAEAGLVGAVIGGGITVPVAGAGFGADVIQGQIDDLEKSLRKRQAVDEETTALGEQLVLERTKKKGVEATQKIETRLEELSKERVELEQEIRDIVQTEADKALEDAIKRTETEALEGTPELTPEVAEQVVKDVEEVAEEVSQQAKTEGISGLVKQAKTFDTLDEFSKGVHTIDIDSLIVKQTKEETFSATGGQKPSRTPGKPLDVLVKEDGTLVLQDGFHRYFELLDKGVKTVEITFETPSSKAVENIWKQAQAEPFEDLSEIADLQRDKPEHAMLRIQHSQISQLYGFVAEAAGDLSHRIFQSPIRFFKGLAGTGEKLNRIHKTLLEKGFVFEDEVKRQIESNLAFEQREGKLLNETVESRTAKLRELSQKYADEHKKLPAINEAQRLAREVAIAVGEWRFDDAIKAVEILQEKFKDRDKWLDFITERDDVSLKPESLETETTADEIIEKVEEKLAPVGPSQPVRREIIKGRLRVLNEEIKDIDEKVASINEQIVEKEKGKVVVGGKKPKKQSTLRLESSKKKLLKQREPLDSERDNVIKIALLNELKVTKPISKERIKFLTDEQRFAVITEEANLILEELEQGQQGERIVPEAQQELTVEQDQEAFGVKTTNPPFLSGDLNLKADPLALNVVGKQQNKKKANRRSKATVMNAVRNIISNPNEEIEISDPAAQALRQRLFDLINDRIEGEQPRFQPGVGQEDPFRTNDVLEQELENLEAGETTIKSGLGTKGRRPEVDTSVTTQSKIETQRLKDQLASALNVDVFKDADIPSGDVVKVQAGVLEKLDQKSIEVQAKALEKGFAQGARATKKNIKQMKRNLKDLLNSTSLPTASKNRIKSLAKLDAEEDLISNLSEIKSQIATEIEAVEVARLKTEIKKLVKRSKPIKVNGVLTGKFTSEIQERLDDIRSSSKLASSDQQINKLVADLLTEMQKVEDTHDVPKQDTSPSALEELHRRLEEAQKSDTVIDPLVNLMLQYKANPRTVGSVKLQELVDGMRTLMEEGKEANKEKLLRRQLEVAELVSSINSFISKGKDLKSISQVGAKANLTSGANFGLQVLSRLSDGWAEILTRVLPERLVNKLDITKEVQEEKGIRRRLADELAQAAARAYGKNGMRLQLKLIADDQVENLGENYVDNRGDSRPKDFSVSQLRKLWMEWQDLSLRETLTGEEQMAEIIENTPEGQEPNFKAIKGNAYPTTVLTTLFDTLTESDKQYAESQLQIYNKFYNEVNAVYSEVNGINLPRIDRYSPIVRDVDGAELILDVFGNEMIFRGLSANNPSLKARVGSMAPLKLQSDTQVFSKHIQANARYIALRKKTQLMTAVFKDADMKQRLAIKYGKFYNQEVQEHLESFVNGANHANTALAKTTNFFNRSFGAAVLGLKAKIGFTQLVSYFAYAETIPVTSFISGTKDFVFNFRKAIKILSQSEFLKNRGANVDQDIARIGKVFTNPFLRKVQFGQDKMVDYTLIFTKIGDRIPIYMGGWAVYQHTLKTTGSKQKAMDAFEKTSSSTQQSSDIDKLSLQQKGNPLMRGLTMFMSAPIAQYRGETRAIRRWSQGELSNRQTAKRLIIYHFIIPQLYTAIANGLLFGEWDKKDQVRALWMGSFNGIPILGDVINSAFRKIQGKESRGKDLFKWAKPMAQMAGDLYDAMEAGIEGDWEEMQIEIIEASLNAATLAGLPSDAIKNVGKGLQDLEDGEPKAATMRFTGHPSGVIENIE